MAGVLQDKLYIERLNESISQAEKTEIGKYAPFSASLMWKEKR